MPARQRPPSAARELIPDRPSLEGLRRAAAGCTACDLYRDATQTVFGEGAADAEVMLVGEQPGDGEDKAGRPFVGPAGHLLDRALEEAGIDRELAYVTNVVKHFKFERRGKLRLHKKPNAEQVHACFPWLEAELAGRPLSPEQRALLEAGDLPGTESVLRDIEWLGGQVDDEERFPAEVREAEVLAGREAKGGAVEDANRLAEQRKHELDEQLARVEQARRRFEEGVREAVQRLSGEFARVCNSAGTEGELRLLAGDRPEEYGIDVLVAHRPGERRRSYRDAAHSGGQRATIAILLLLATMGAADAADLLIMDEHIAHLDSTNIDHVAELMHALADRVQFLLATPTNAESLRLSWCDLQLAFLPRDPGRAYSPSIRLLSRLGVGDLEERAPQRELSVPG